MHDSRCRMDSGKSMSRWTKNRIQKLEYSYIYCQKSFGFYLPTLVKFAISSNPSHFPILGIQLFTVEHGPFINVVIVSTCDIDPEKICTGKFGTIWFQCINESKYFSQENLWPLRHSNARKPPFMWNIQASYPMSDKGVSHVQQVTCSLSHNHLELNKREELGVFSGHGVVRQGPRGGTFRNN